MERRREGRSHGGTPPAASNPPPVAAIFNPSSPSQTWTLCSSARFSHASAPGGWSLVPVNVPVLSQRRGKLHLIGGEG